MVKKYGLMTWKQFEKRKMVSKQEIVLVDNEQEALKNMQIYNSERRRTTSSYHIYMLEKAFADAGLALKVTKKKQ